MTWSAKPRWGTSMKPAPKFGRKQISARNYQEFYRHLTGERLGPYTAKASVQIMRECLTWDYSWYICLTATMRSYLTWKGYSPDPR